jgi:hypothetical protein
VCPVSVTASAGPEFITRACDFDDDGKPDTYEVVVACRWACSCGRYTPLDLTPDLVVSPAPPLLQLSADLSADRGHGETS